MPHAPDGDAARAPFGIVPRDLHFDIVGNANPAWLDGDPVRSAIVDGFAVMLPEGERFFIRALKHYAPKVPDPAVREGVQGYARQEAFHTREHEAYNAALRRLGADVDAMEARARRLLDPHTRPIVRLAATCAIEQITYSFSRAVLGSRLLEGAAAPYRQLWQWHSLEEVEHSAVALSVFHAAPWSGPRWLKYALRVGVLFIVIVQLVRGMAGNAATLLAGPDGRLGWRMRLRLGWALLGRPWLARMLFVPCLAYLKPGYAGGGGRDQDLVERGRQLLRDDRATA